MGGENADGAGWSHEGAMYPCIIESSHEGAFCGIIDVGLAPKTSSAFAYFGTS